MADEIFVVETSYKIEYTTGKPVPISEIVDSLLAIDNLIKRTGPFVEKAFEGIRVTDVEVFVKSLESGSVKKDFLVKYVFKGEENYENAKAVIDQVLKDNVAIRTITAAGVGALLTAGLMSVLPSNKPATHIEAYKNTIVNIGGKVNLTGDEIATILDRVTDKKTLARKAVDAVRPAKHDDSEIKIEGVTGLNLSSDFVAEAPSEYTPPKPGEQEKPHTNASVFISASDRDRNAQGWAGLIPGIVDTRTKIVLAESVDPKRLHGRTKVSADIVVHSRYLKSSKSYVPKFIEIVRVL